GDRCPRQRFLQRPGEQAATREREAQHGTAVLAVDDVLDLGDVVACERDDRSLADLARPHEGGHFRLLRPFRPPTMTPPLRRRDWMNSTVVRINASTITTS